ncbi:MAG TPA: hypothetical protein VIV11_07440 [Kofleriaceae bacterium]
MALLRPLLLAAALTACATARWEPTGDQAQPDAGTTTQVDAPRQTGSADASMSGGCTQAFTGTLASWSFATETGTQPSTPVTTKAPGVTAGPIERAPALTPVSGANAMNSSNWPLTTQPDPTKNYKLTIAPPSGCTLSITGLAIDAKASATGPTMAAVTTSVDSYGQQTAISTALASTPALSIPAQTAMIELRVSGYGANATTGTLRLQGTFTLTGSLQ